MVIKYKLSSSNNIFIDWLRPEHFSDILEIETQSGECLWSKADLRSKLKIKNVFGYVSRTLFKVVGFVIYELHQSHVNILNLAVHDQCRRRGIGSSLLKKMKTKRPVTEICVRESNLTAHKFLAHNKFVAKNVVKNYFQEPEIESAYKFEFTN